jgi:hypothetical protein
MAAKNRKELNENELAGALFDQLQQVKPHLPKIIVGAAVLGLIYWSIAYTVSTRASAKESKSTNMILFTVENSAAGSTARLDTQIEEFPEDNSSAWAYLLKGDRELGQGMSRIFADKETGRETIRRAINNFEKANKLAGDDLLLKERSLFAWARGLESLGLFDEAAEKYAEVTLIEDSPLSSLAKKGILRVNNSDNREFYVLFESKENNVFETDSTNTAPATDSGLPPRPDFTYPGEEPVPGASEPTLGLPGSGNPSGADLPPVPPTGVDKTPKSKPTPPGPPETPSPAIPAPKSTGTLPKEDPSGSPKKNTP